MQICSSKKCKMLIYLSFACMIVRLQGCKIERFPLDYKVTFYNFQHSQYLLQIGENQLVGIEKNGKWYGMVNLRHAAKFTTLVICLKVI